jgi:hypothetical protein
MVITLKLKKNKRELITQYFIMKKSDKSSIETKIRFMYQISCDIINYTNLIAQFSKNWNFLLTLYMIAYVILVVTCKYWVMISLILKCRWEKHERVHKYIHESDARCMWSMYQIGVQKFRDERVKRNFKYHLLNWLL